MLLNLAPSLFAPELNFKPLQTDKLYDVIIIGAGPSGLTAAVYCLRKGLKTGLVSIQVGGQMADTSGIENYLGYRYINGMELVEKFREQVLQFGIDFETKAPVQSIEDGDIKRVHLEDGRAYRTRTLIIASGKQYKKLGVPGEQELTGHGVAYCSICDAPLFVGKKVVVSGGGNSGVAAAIDLAKVAEHVTLIQRRDHLTGDKLLIEKLQAYQNVDYLFEHIVTQIQGENTVTGVTILNKKTGESFEKAVDGIFVEIGLIPNSGLVQGILELNEYQEILVDCHCRTSVPGIFAAGDVTSVPFKQIIIACGEGAKAALSANEYILNRAD